MADEMRKDPVEDHLDTRASLVKWVYNQHDAVNRQIGKKSISLDEFITTYKSMKDPAWKVAKKTAETPWWVPPAVAVMAVVVVMSVRRGGVAATASF